MTKIPERIQYIAEEEIGIGDNIILTSTWDMQRDDLIRRNVRKAPAGVPSSGIILVSVLKGDIIDETHIHFRNNNPASDSP